ncbi:mediator of RNA polymerase II transcription subunit 21-like isoform X3 [Macadamia integrifolia]|uniref:mediator of RNA polymerase II transcription subunit 21-like isoform X3 n=1 Tax=Macadamia integrifolia TaxID=60698 RepID=UPI001C532F5A|nr:mediator of RNA polymerase II transcription subunit 21-like isoform X3 [Macadamia integrifolia]
MCMIRWKSCPSVLHVGFCFLALRGKMDIISQLQEQVNTIASLAFNTFGTLQRDAPSVRLSPNYPEPPPANPSEDTVNIAEQPKQMSIGLVKAAKQYQREMTHNWNGLQHLRLKMKQWDRNFKGNWKQQSKS